MDTFIAVYEQGVLRPLQRLNLAEHTRVQVQIVENAPSADAPLLALANLGESDETDVAARAKEILAAEVKPATGWTASDANAR
jgi:predicted DNA-binding antitoxin AbrB/MazE fold protein